MHRVLYITILILLLGCSKNNAFIYSYEEFYEGELMFQDEIHFFPDNSCVRYHMEPNDKNKIAHLRIYTPMSYEKKGDTLLIFSSLNNLEKKGTRYIVQGDNLVPISSHVPQLTSQKIRPNSKKSIKTKLKEIYKPDSITCLLHCLETDPYYPYYIQFSIDNIGKPMYNCNEYDTTNIN